MRTIDYEGKGAIRLKKQKTIKHGGTENQNQERNK